MNVVVTDAAMAVNPRCAELADRLRRAGLPVVGIDALAAHAAKAATRPTPPRATGRVVAVSEYRDGSVTDVVRQIEE